MGRAGRSGDGGGSIKTNPGIVASDPGRDQLMRGSQMVLNNINIKYFSQDFFSLHQERGG